VLVLALVAGERVPPAGAAGPIIDVEKEGDRRITVGVDLFKDLARDLAGPAGDVLAFDLELSGWFEPIRPGALPPKSLGDWQRKGAEVVIELAPAASGGFTGRVKDTGSGETLLERAYFSADGSTRRRLHRFADDVVQTLTGEPGLARTQIVCEWDTGKGKRIVRMDIDGQGLKELTGEGALEMAPRWTHDGAKILYTSFASGYPDVYLHDLDGPRKRVAHYEGLNAFGDLHPTGDLLVLTMSSSGDPEICTKDLASGKIRRLTRHKATDTSPVWSPDGRRIAFVSDRTGQPQVYVMNADGSSQRQVTVRGSYNTAPEWSPDGTRIAYCALRPDGFQIQVVDLATSETTTVTEGGGCEDPCWSPDGRSLLYSRSAGGRTDLYVTNLSERSALRITRGAGKFTTPDWSPFP
jgi:TolB protein